MVCVFISFPPLLLIWHPGIGLVSVDQGWEEEEEGERQHLNSGWGIEWALVQTQQWPSGRALFWGGNLVFLLFSALCVALINS